MSALEPTRDEIAAMSGDERTDLFRSLISRMNRAQLEALEREMAAVRERGQRRRAEARRDA